MAHICFDGTQECICGFAVEELDVDRLPSFERRREKAMHPIYHPHGATVDHNWRQFCLGFRQPFDMRPVFPL
jgi:hypothetical protein